jgi:hypothetical protein
LSRHFFGTTFLVALDSHNMENQHDNHSAELDKCMAPDDLKERKRWQNRMAQRTYREARLLSFSDATNVMCQILGLNRKKRQRALTEAAAKSTSNECGNGPKSQSPSSVAAKPTIDATSLATPSTTMSGSTPNASEEPWSILSFEGPQFQNSPAYGADISGMMDIA